MTALIPPAIQLLWVEKVFLFFAQDEAIQFIAEPSFKKRKPKKVITPFSRCILQNFLGIKLPGTEYSGFKWQKPPSLISLETFSQQPNTTSSILASEKTARAAEL
jgi:hypothetical protein